MNGFTSTGPQHLITTPVHVNEKKKNVCLLIYSINTQHWQESGKLFKNKANNTTETSDLNIQKYLE